MFITPAYAQSAGGGGGNPLLELLFPLVAVGAIMWFLVIRPQRQAAKARQTMLDNVRRNDTVISGGGVIGKVTKVIDDQELEVQIATDVKVRMLRSMIAEVRVKGEPVKADAKAVKADNSNDEGEEKPKAKTKAKSTPKTPRTKK